MHIDTFGDERLWLAQMLRCEEGDVDHQLIAGDASPRKFYRISQLTQGEAGQKKSLSSQILMVSPPTENNERFILVQGQLDAFGIRVPRLLRADLSLGFFLLEDLGDETFWSALQTKSEDRLYVGALTLLSRMQAVPVPDSVLTAYDDHELQRELNICPEWFFDRALSMRLDAAAEVIFDRFSRCLLQAAAEQPAGFVHRDYHSRNLMMLGVDDIAIIDFQDAIMGPITYDVASLLKDVYIVWPRSQQLEWLEHYWRLLVDAGRLSRDSWEQFLRWFDLIGLQRHIKILGVFSRLWLRDDKPAYMTDIPVVIDYIAEACALYGDSYPAIAEFWTWFEKAVLPLAREADWYSRS